jgi:hypothetical protein
MAFAWRSRVGHLAVGVLLLALAPSAHAERICEDIFVPPDNVRRVCRDVIDCSSGSLLPEEESACRAMCESRSARRTEMCRRFVDDEIECEPDEELVGGRCVPLNCGPDRRAVDGRCVPLRKMAQAPGPKCIDQPDLERVKMLVELAESLVEARVRNTIVLAVARFVPVQLPGNRIIVAGPELGGAEEADLRESVEKVTAEWKLTCQAGSIVRGENCGGPIEDLLRRQEAQVAGPLDAQLTALAEEITMGPDFNVCVQQRDRRTLVFNELGIRTQALNKRNGVANRFINAIRRAPTTVLIECTKPDVTKCSIGLTGDMPEPAIRPDEAKVKRALKAIGVAGTE